MYGFYFLWKDPLLAKCSRKSENSFLELHKYVSFQKSTSQVKMHTHIKCPCYGYALSNKYFYFLLYQRRKCFMGYFTYAGQKVLYKYCLERCYGRKVTTPTNVEMANMNRPIPIVFPSWNLESSYSSYTWHCILGF